MIRQQLRLALAAALVLAGCGRDDGAGAATVETAEAVVTVGPENIAVATLSNRSCFRSRSSRLLSA